jgi:hypothetical protein
MGKSDEIIALLWSVDFFCDENKGLIENWNLLYQLSTLCSMQQFISFQIPTRPLPFSQKINALKIE